MFITALFTIARTLKQPRCPSADEWIRKLWYIYTMEYYSAIKKNAFESVLMKWMRMHCLLTAFPQLPQGSPQSELSEHSSPACLMLQFQAGTRVSMTEERLQHWDTEGPQTWSSVWEKRVKPLLVLTWMVHRRQSKSHCGQTTTAHAPELTECPHWLLLLQHFSLLEQGCQCWERDIAHIWRELSWLRLKLQGFHTSNVGPDPTLNRVMIATEHKTSSDSKLALD